MAINPLTAGGSGITKTLMDAQDRAREKAFDIQFNNLQNQAIKKINEEVERISDPEGTQKKLDGLKASMADLEERKAKIQEYMQANSINRENLITMTETTSKAMTEMKLGDLDFDALSKDEAEEINRLVAKLKDQGGTILQLRMPNMWDGDAVMRTKAALETVQEYTAVAGPLDDEGTPDDEMSNDNRRLLDSLDTLMTAAGTAADVATNVTYAGTQMLMDINERLADVQQEAKEMTVVEAGEKEEEIQRVKVKWATWLRAIELSFDASNAHFKQVQQQLTNGPQTDPGSIVSILG